MAPLLLRAAHQSSVLLSSGAEPKEDVSEAGNKVVHQNEADLIMFAGIFALPFVFLMCIVGHYVFSRAAFEEKKNDILRSLKLTRQNSGESADPSLRKTLSPQLSPEDGEPPSSPREQELEEALQTGGLKSLLLTKMNIMLIFVPLGFAAHFMHWGPTAVFLINCLGMLPLAGLMGTATEELALHTSQAVGGLLNATFGNAVELIFVVQSLRGGLITVTKGTLLGSILANELLVLGMALFFGGLVDKEGKFCFNKQQSFSKESALIQSQLLLFSAFMVCMPSMFEKAYHIETGHVLRLSRLGSICAIIGYVVYMVFSLYTHKDLLAAGEDKLEDGEEQEQASVSASVAGGILAIATLLVAIASEFLVHSIEGFAHEFGFSESFIGVVLLPIIGNACEHSSAILVALKDKVTLAIGIAIGSTIQVSLFVVPVAVIVGWILDVPMNLDFHRLNSWALLLSSLLVMSVLVVGKSTWMNGFVLITAYCVLAFLYFLSPDDALA